MDVSAPDEDTIIIRRYMENGRDALGNPAESGEEIIEVRR
jgi:hypothetical protein